MKEILQVNRKEPIVLLTPEIIYGHRIEWCNAVYRPLRMSILRPRYFFPYDTKQVLPVIVWFCGGAFTEVDRNVWMPELAWFAKHGWAVVSIDYSTVYRSYFPQLVEDVKLGIRYLKAHGEEYNLDTSRIAVMGESAGGYLAALCGATSRTGEYDRYGGYDGYTAEVQAAISWYPAVRMTVMEVDPSKAVVPYDWNKYDDVTSYVKPDVPPFLILHGDADSSVPVTQGELLYDALIKVGADASMIVVDGAEHADSAFVQPEVKERILDFLNKKVP